MPTFCLVLTGQPVEDPSPGDVDDALAAAFSMDRETFRERVWQRAPLIVRQALAEDEAATQAEHLRLLGAQVLVLPEHTPLLWLLRDERVLGPLPEGALARFAQPGDRWCPDGSTDWRDATSSDGTAPPSLPIARTLPGAAMPPPLAGAYNVTRRRGRMLLWVVASVVVLLLGYLWLGRSHALKVDQAVTHIYTPRPLQPLDRSLRPALATHCQLPSTAPANDEDRFLLTGGERSLAGISQRRGSVYVAEAITGFDAQCRPDAAQLYAFRDGVLLGPLLRAPVDPRRVQLANLQLDDDGLVRYTLTMCDASSDSCAAPIAHTARVPHAAGGGAPVQTPIRAPDASPLPGGIVITNRTAPRYPAEAIRQRHQGTVILHITLDGSGAPTEVALDQSSGHAELDQAALEAVRQWRFKTAPKPNGEPASAVEVRLPVRFDLSQPKS